MPEDDEKSTLDDFSEIADMDDKSTVADSSESTEIDDIMREDGGMENNTSNQDEKGQQKMYNTISIEKEMSLIKKSYDPLSNMVKKVASMWIICCSYSLMLYAAYNNVFEIYRMYYNGVLETIVTEKLVIALLQVVVMHMIVVCGTTPVAMMEGKTTTNEIVYQITYALSLSGFVGLGLKIAQNSDANAMVEIAHQRIVKFGQKLAAAKADTNLEGSKKDVVEQLVDDWEKQLSCEVPTTMSMLIRCNIDQKIHPDAIVWANYRTFAVTFYVTINIAASLIIVLWFVKNIPPLTMNVVRIREFALQNKSPAEEVFQAAHMSDIRQIA